MLICGSGSGIRVPLKANSRGKALVFNVVVDIFISPNDYGNVIECCHNDEIKHAAVVLIHELQRGPVRPCSPLPEFRKISELVLV